MLQINVTSISIKYNISGGQSVKIYLYTEWLHCHGYGFGACM